MSIEWNIDQEIKRLISCIMSGNSTLEDSQALQHAISDRARRMRRLPKSNYR